MVSFLKRAKLEVNLQRDLGHLHFKLLSFCALELAGRYSFDDNENLFTNHYASITTSNKSIGKVNVTLPPIGKFRFFSFLSKSCNRSSITWTHCLIHSSDTVANLIMRCEKDQFHEMQVVCSIVNPQNPRPWNYNTWMASFSFFFFFSLFFSIYTCFSFLLTISLYLKSNGPVAL